MQAYIEAPQETQILSPSIFLAGGISGCEDWQYRAHRFLDAALSGYNHTILNPRRKDFDLSDQNATHIQIDWEYRHLRLADVVLFWFPEETLCPIALYELGAMAMSNKPLVVGCHPNYKRLVDVRIQLELQKPSLKVHTEFNDMIGEAAAKLGSGRF